MKNRMEKRKIEEKVKVSIYPDGSIRLSKNSLKVINAWRAAGFDVFIEYELFAKPSKVIK